MGCPIQREHRADVPVAQASIRVNDLQSGRSVQEETLLYSNKDSYRNGDVGVGPLALLSAQEDLCGQTVARDTDLDLR